MVICTVIIGVGLLVRSLMQPDDVILAGKKKVSLQLQWFDQAQFAGFYVAKEKNFYDTANLDVRIIPGGYNVNPIARVMQGEADIGLATGDQVLISRAEGRSIKAIGTVFNTSLACFMSKKNSKINSPYDLVEKKVGVYRGFDTENVLLSMLKKHGIRPEAVKIRDAGSIEAFVTGELEAFPSYIFNEPVSMKEKQIEVNIMRPSDFGIQFYSDTIFTSQEYWGKNRDALEKFLQASARGWLWAKSNPNEALDIMFRHRGFGSRTQESGKHQQEQLKIVLQYIGAGPRNEIFYMERSVWGAMEQSLYDIGKLKKRGHIQGLCDFTILEEATN